MKTKLFSMNIVRRHNFAGSIFEYNQDIYYIWEIDFEQNRVQYAWASGVTDLRIIKSDAGLDLDTFLNSVKSGFYKIKTPQQLMGTDYERKYLMFKNHQWESLISK